MKKYLNNGFIIIGIISSILFLIIYLNNDYMEVKERKCVILDKMVAYSISEKYYLILRDERGIEFDLTVRPVTYSRNNIGDKININLKDFDIKQSFKENFIYFSVQLLQVLLDLFV